MNEIKPSNYQFAESTNYGSYIIAIGASAGGLEAIHEFFDHMPGTSNFSFVVIQHLSPDYKSLLVELVSKHTHMKVFEAVHNMNIQPDCVYIIPNNKLMTIKGDKLKLADKSQGKAPNTAIDTFLLSLAEQKRKKAIAIILSGTGTDGTRGSEAIKECGGMVIVQDPATAKFDGMPNSAIAAGNADYILPPSKMHLELYSHIEQEPLVIFENGKMNDNLLDEIFKMVYNSSGHDFNLYKTPTIVRRITRRMMSLNIKSLKSYVDYLKENPPEVKILGKDFLIGVTKFFRDKGAFDFIAQNIIPKIVNQKNDGDTLKVWVCACSTGEEAYSIAILINEKLESLNKTLDVKIFATDIDDASIDIAAKNSYPLDIAKEIGPALLKKYFVKEGKYYSVIPVIRKQIVFAKHNVIKSPPFIKNDLITCRNMLIYMNSLLQQKVLSTFHFSLNPKGILFLGSSETVASVKEGFTELSSKWRVFQKTGNLNYSANHTYTAYSTNKQNEKLPEAKNIGTQKDIEDDIREFIFEEHGFVGCYIDKNYEIKETFGDFKRYLSLPEKKLDLNILKMVPQSISVLLNTAIRKTWKENKKTYLKQVRILKDNNEVLLNIAVKPPNNKSNLGFTLILINEVKVDLHHDKEGIVLTPVLDEQQNEYLMTVEAELNETRANLQMAVEEMETTNEELQSSNEELLSANEELQSSNEELQSLNEELHTLNTEHQLKIKELVELNEDLDNYFRSTDIGQIFLDSNLNIRKFNPAAVQIVNLIEADIGRPINHISSNIRYDNLISDVHSVLAKGVFIEKEIQVRAGTNYLMRILPYLKKDKKRDGVVISFVDVSTITELNNIIAGVFNATSSAIYAFKAIRDSDNRIIDLKCISSNSTASALIKNYSENPVGETMTGEFRKLFEQALFEKFVKVIETNSSFKIDSPLRNSPTWYHISAAKMADGVVVNLTDISERKISEQKLKKNYNELIQTREDLKKLNSELEDKVNERTLELSESEERFKLVSEATNDTIWDWNLVTNHMWRSENFTKMFGYELDQQTSNLNFWIEKVHPEDRDRVKESVYDTINQNDGHWSQQYRLLKANDEYAVIMDRGSLLFNEFGVPYRMVGSMVDISVLIEAKKQMSKSETRFKKVFESNMIGMFFSDMDGTMFEANDSFLKMIGYTRDELKKNQINWKDLTPPEYIEVSEQANSLIKEQGFCAPFEKQYIRKDGTLVPVLMGSAVFDDDAQLSSVTYCIDITKQKETEEKRKELQKLIKKQQDEFYSVFRNAPALISIKRGQHLAYEFKNKAFEEFEALNFQFTSFQNKNDNSIQDEILHIEEQVKNDGRSYVGRAFHFQRVDDETGQSIDAWYDLTYTPVYANNGKVDGIAFFGFDVTDMIRAQKETRQLMEKKDEFMSIASHELKTPITSLKGAIQIVQRLTGKKADNGNIYPFIEKANKQAGRLTTLVDDLLNVTRIQEGKMLFNFTRFNASEMIADCVEEAEVNHLSHKIVIEKNADVQLYADRPRLEQVINNFLMNAIKYSPESTKVVVSAEVKNNKFKVSVTDFGIGIPDDKKIYVFDRFFRVEQSSHKFSGLGLGLYISSGIIKRHHGEIGVTSEENLGSTFWFQIPLNGLEK